MSYLVYGGNKLSEITVSELLPRLTTEFNYPEKGARIVANKLVVCTPQVKAAFMQWWQGGELPDLQIEGYTVQWLIEQHNMKPIAAFLTLDWLSREPEAAIASLKRGHDHVR